MADDSLPIGVGRVPQWWMDCTPHYILDLEEDQARRQAEQQMAFYFEQMAKAADAGYLDENGNPILGPDGKPLMDWGGGGGNNGWQGRGPGGGSGFGPVDGPLGRNFVPGRVTPESLALLGITESDPNYQIYLSGKKYPPGYWNKLADLGYLGPGITANNLHQTDFGRYGRQAEVPKHKPAWAKMKLKTTSTGQNIRQGRYEDSPGDTMRRAKGDGSSQNFGYNHEADAPPSPVASPRSLRPTPVAAPAPALEATPTPVAAPAPAPAPIAAPEPAPAVEGKKKRLVRKVRKVRRKKPEGEPTIVMEAADEQRARSGAYKPGEVPTEPSTIRTTPAQQPQYQQQQQQAQNHEEEEYSEAFEEEEVIEDEEPLEESEYFEEEVLDDEDDNHHNQNHHHQQQQQRIPEVAPPAPAPAPAATPDISDLQAILAAKQAELARLQASLGS